MQLTDVEIVVEIFWAVGRSAAADLTAGLLPQHRPLCGAAALEGAPVSISLAEWSLHRAP